ncbi:MAG TPA: PorV/PorQ family protein, partial [Candidatus Bathyarchaeia archaeon]|nr:PorV/PorQ family protein [Candidatus Bathyarchaeia archaeon]
MKSAKVGVLVVAALMISTGALRAQGEAGAQCLIIPPSARANGLGQSYVAIADDATASWWNPGGLAFVNVAFDLMHSQLVPELASDVFYEYVGGVARVQGLGTVGGSLIYLSYGDWQGTDANNNPTGVFSSWEVAPTLSGAVKVLNNLGIGMNLKFVYIDLAPASATVEKQPGRGHSVALDVGALWKVPDFNLFGYTVSRLNLGLCVSNLGPA